jgi:FkbH-like protein
VSHRGLSALIADETLTRLQSLVNSGNPADAVSLLRQTITSDLGFTHQSRLAALFTPSFLAGADLRPLRIAILSSSTVDHFVDVFRMWLAIVGIRAEFYVSPYDTIVPTILDATSGLYEFRPDLVWLTTTYRDVRIKVSADAGPHEVRREIDGAIREISSLWKTASSRLNCIVLQNNADVPAFDAFGNFSGAVSWGSRNVLRLYNTALAEAAPSGVVIFDFDHIASLFGKLRWVDDRYWFLAKHAFNPDATGLVAASAARLIAGVKGLAKKCLVLDLDNTIWGGVIGDDGIDGIKLGPGPDGEAFVALQDFARSLKERGIVLAVCSKNEEVNAKEPFEKHPDMRLKLEDVAVFRANWNNKVDNLRDIAKILNIGLDSIVFLDDNPAERAIVREFLPMVETPDLPEDPSGYVRALARYAYFETISFTKEDEVRARSYRDNAQREELLLSLGDTESYLRSLEMVGDVGALDGFSVPRVGQLINKSNQFHLTGTRYSEAELLALSGDPNVTIKHFRLTDRFGDNGLISAVVLRQAGDSLDIDTWVMSCRVLGRSMEEFIANEIALIARARKARVIVGIYRPSAKNKLVASLYHRLGFSEVESGGDVSRWIFDITNSNQPFATQVQRKAVTATVA